MALPATPFAVVQPYGERTAAGAQGAASVTADYVRKNRSQICENRRR